PKVPNRLALTTRSALISAFLFSALLFSAASRPAHPQDAPGNTGSTVGPQVIRLFMHDDAPVTAGLVIDCSGSMRENRDEVAEAAKDFLASSNPQDQIFVVNFNETAHLGLPADIPFTSDVSQLVSAVETGPSKGLTALYDAVAIGLRHLALGANQKKALIIVSDGGDDASYLNFKKTLAAVQHSSTVIYTIGIVASDQANVDPG